MGYKVLRAKTADQRKEAEQALSRILERRHAADVKFASIAVSAASGDTHKGDELLEGAVDSFDAACHQRLLKKAVEHCGAFDDYSMRYARLFANMCAAGLGEEQMTAAIVT